MTDLNILARTLAERITPHPQTCTEKYCTCTGWVKDERFRVEAVIREAIDKTIESVEEILRSEGIEYEISAKSCDAAGNTVGGGFDTASSLTCKRLLEKVRSLKQSNSGMEVRK